MCDKFLSFQSEFALPVLVNKMSTRGTAAAFLTMVVICVARFSHMVSLLMALKCFGVIFTLGGSLGMLQRF